MEKHFIANDQKKEKSFRCGAANKKIRTQFRDTPEHKLCYAVVEQAINDLCDAKEERSAKRYLIGEIVHAELCGVDSDWVRRVILKCGLSLD